MSDFKGKMHQNRFSLRLQILLGELKTLTQIPSWNKRDLLLRESREGAGKGRGGEGGKRREGGKKG